MLEGVVTISVCKPANCYRDHKEGSSSIARILLLSNRPRNIASDAAKGAEVLMLRSIRDERNYSSC